MAGRRSAKFKAFDEQITLAIATVTEYERDLLEVAADQIFDRAREQNRQVLGYAPGETLSVDGIVGKAVRDMENHAVLDFEFGSDIIQWTSQLLKMVSPRSGANDKDPTMTYAESWAVIVNGKRVNPLATEYDGVSPISWVNTVPYARKIAAGLSKSRPNGWLEALVLPQIKKRYSNLFYLQFSYETVPGLEALILDHGTRHKGQVAINRIRRWPTITADPK